VGKDKVLIGDNMKARYTNLPSPDKINNWRDDKYFGHIDEDLHLEAMSYLREASKIYTDIPERDINIFLKKYNDNLSYEEIAREYDLGVRRVKEIVREIYYIYIKSYYIEIEQSDRNEGRKRITEYRGKMRDLASKIPKNILDEIAIIRDW